MTQKEIANLLRNYRNAKMAAAEADKLGVTIKAYMASEGLTELSGGGYVAMVSTFTTTRVDTTAMKKAMPDVVSQYTTSSVQTRLTVK